MTSVNIQQVLDSGELTMTSLEVAELTGKSHDNVLRDIRKVRLSIKYEDVNENNFTYRVEIIKTSRRGRPVNNYLMSEGMSLLLLSGYRKQLTERFRLIQYGCRYFETKRMH